MTGARHAEPSGGTQPRGGAKIPSSADHTGQSILSQGASQIRKGNLRKASRRTGKTSPDMKSLGRFGQGDGGGGAGFPDTV